MLGLIKNPIDDFLAMEPLFHHDDTCVCNLLIYIDMGSSVVLGGRVSDTEACGTRFETYTLCIVP